MVLYTAGMAPDDEMAARLDAALDLADLAVEMVELRVRRERPELSDQEVQRLVAAWRRERPGAASGDAEGRLVAWPRAPQNAG